MPAGARPVQRRPRPWAETRGFGTRYVWRFENKRYRTGFYEDPEQARADATAQISEQLQGTWQDRSGPRMLLEDWIDIWVTMLGDIEPTTVAKYKYFVEGHILPQFQGRQLGSLTFEEIEAWEAGITRQVSARGRPYAQSVAVSARSLLITILGDAVHARKIDRNPAERRRGRRGKVRASGRRMPAHLQQQTSVLAPAQALCIAERCALLSGRDVDFVMNVFAAWTGVRWGELLAVEGGQPTSGLRLTSDGISTYAVDWQLRELGGVVRKAAPKDGSYRVLDLPPFLAGLMRSAVDNRLKTCSCPSINGRPACKGDDRTPAGYLFLGPKGGHPRGSNYSEDFLIPAAEGTYPLRKGVRRQVYVTAEPWPGVPIRKGSRAAKAADLADGTWPAVAQKVHPHAYRHAHATWLENAGLSKVIQMDRRGHSMPGMDRVYTHVTMEMRQRLCDVLEDLWEQALTERRGMNPRSPVPVLDRFLTGRNSQPESDLAPQSAPQAVRSDLARERET
jgi:integrase